MTPSSAMAIAGFSVLLAQNGEALTFANANLQGLVNRNIVKGKDFFRAFNNVPANFDVLGLTEIEVLKSSVPSSPESGQSFSDSFGYRHRIRIVTQTDVTWLCFCTPSKVPA